jgi:hypothetical protein
MKEMLHDSMNHPLQSLRKEPEHLRVKSGKLNIRAYIATDLSNKRLLSFSMVGKVREVLTWRLT